MYQEYYSFSHLFNEDLFYGICSACMCVCIFVCPTGKVAEPWFGSVWFGLASFYHSVLAPAHSLRISNGAKKSVRHINTYQTLTFG